MPPESRPLPPITPGVVDRCVCQRMLFAEWLEIRRAEGLDLTAMAERTLCGEACGTCRPYLAVVAVTGRARLPVLDLETLLELGRGAQ